MQSYKQLPLQTLQKLILYEVMNLEKTHNVSLLAIAPSDTREQDNDTLATYEHLRAVVSVRNTTKAYALLWSTDLADITDIGCTDIPSDDPTSTDAEHTLE